MQVVEPILFAGLALAAFAQWWRHRDVAEAWLVAAFTALGIFVVATALLPDEADWPGFVWVQTALIAVLVLFPYSLYRFMASLMTPVRWIRIVADVLTLGVVVATFLLPTLSGDGERETQWTEYYVILLLVQWVFLSSRVVVRFWQAGREQPPVARRRMHLMALGAAGVAATVVVAAELADDPTRITQLVAFAMAALLLLGYAPPYGLRRRWRKEEVEAAKRVQRELMSATSTEQVTATLLPHARKMLGASAVVLETADGEPIGRDPADEVAPDPDVESTTKESVLEISMDTHRLRIHTSPITPFFGREEITDLEALAALAELALTRNAVLDEQRRLATIVESSESAILSKTLDGIITSWNLGAEKLYGYTRDEMIGKPIAVLLPPGDDDEVPAVLERIRNNETIDHFETKRRTKDGHILDVSVTISPMRDASDNIIGASTIARDITHRVRLERELKEATHAAETANLAKSEFLSRMSHELRTPLNAILGFGQLLEMEPLTSDQHDSLIQIIKGGRRLLDLINEVLDISRIETGTLQLSIEPVPVRSVINDAVELIRPLADERGIRLRSELPSELAESHVIADQQRVGQILLNLLSNAVKYNVADGRVSVTAAQVDDHLRIGVTDTGPGIPEEKIPMLFTPFERLGADATGVEGTGLGLALSKSLVEAMGGRLEVDTMLGEGTTFWVELHRADPPLQEAVASEEIGRATANGRRVLYIEDNLSNLKLIERLLVQAKGIEVISAMTGALGLDMAQQHLPDLVLLDVHLPDTRGEEVLIRLRKDPRTKDIPVVMLSADATPGQIKRILAAGADEYITKPIDVPAFLGVIERILEP